MTTSPARLPARLVVAATRNPGKVREMTPVLAPALATLGCELRPLGEDAAEAPREDRETFAGNAAIKAVAAAEGLGLVALGEDSGLEVDALGGRPGVSSARFSGGGPAENNHLLLQLMEEVPQGRRAARFHSVVALKAPKGPLFLSRGMAEGEILPEMRGEGGFGYDPLFLSHDLGRSFAEASKTEKNLVSHRSRALRALRGYLFEALPEGELSGETDRRRASRCGRTGARWVPGVRWCLEALKRAGCPAGLVAHQVAVARLCRETALMLVESGHTVDPALLSAAALLHDIAKAPGDGSAERLGPARPPPAQSTTGEFPPVGVTAHAWEASLWTRRQGLHPGLERAVMVHGLDSLASPVFAPSTWEERVLMLCDKLAEDVFVGLTSRIEGLRRRHPQASDLIARAAPLLRALEEEIARTVGLDAAGLEAALKSVLENVMVFDAGAGIDDVEFRFGVR